MPRGRRGGWLSEVGGGDCRPPDPRPTRPAPAKPDWVGAGPHREPGRRACYRAFSEAKIYRCEIGGKSRSGFAATRQLPRGTAGGTAECVSCVYALLTVRYAPGVKPWARGGAGASLSNFPFSITHGVPGDYSIPGVGCPAVLAHLRFAGVSAPAPPLVTPYFEVPPHCLRRVRMLYRGRPRAGRALHLSLGGGTEATGAQSGGARVSPGLVEPAGDRARRFGRGIALGRDRRDRPTRQ